MVWVDVEKRKCYLEVSQWGPLTKTSAPAKKANFCAAFWRTVYTFTLLCYRPIIPCLHNHWMYVKSKKIPATHPQGPNLWVFFHGQKFPGPFLVTRILLSCPLNNLVQKCRRRPFQTLSLVQVVAGISIKDLDRRVADDVPTIISMVMKFFCGIWSVTKVEASAIKSRQLNASQKVMSSVRVLKWRISKSFWQPMVLIIFDSCDI